MNNLSIEKLLFSFGIPFIINESILKIIVGESRGWNKTGPIQTRIIYTLFLLLAIILIYYIIKYLKDDLVNVNKLILLIYFVLWALNLYTYLAGYNIRNIKYDLLYYVSFILLYFVGLYILGSCENDI